MFTPPIRGVEMSWFLDASDVDVEDSVSMQWQNIIRSDCWLNCGRTFAQGFLFTCWEKWRMEAKSAKSDTKIKVSWKRRYLVQILWNSWEPRIGQDWCCPAKIDKYSGITTKSKSPVSRCHLQLTSATIKSTERPANQPTIDDEEEEEEVFSPLVS